MFAETEHSNVHPDIALPRTSSVMEIAIVSLQKGLYLLQYRYRLFTTEFY